LVIVPEMVNASLSLHENMNKDREMMAVNIEYFFIL
jgi:hypothetical protein